MTKREQAELAAYMARQWPGQYEDEVLAIIVSRVARFPLKAVMDVLRDYAAMDERRRIAPHGDLLLRRLGVRADVRRSSSNTAFSLLRMIREANAQSSASYPDDREFILRYYRKRWAQRGGFDTQNNRQFGQLSILKECAECLMEVGFSRIQGMRMAGACVVCPPHDFEPFLADALMMVPAYPPTDRR